MYTYHCQPFFPEVFDLIPNPAVPFSLGFTELLFGANPFILHALAIVRGKLCVARKYIKKSWLCRTVQYVQSQIVGKNIYKKYIIVIGFGKFGS